MTQCSFINQTKVQKLHGYQTWIELLLAMNFFEILYNIIPQTPKALRTTGGFVQAGLDVQTSAVCIAVLWFWLDGILLGF